AVLGQHHLVSALLQEDLRTAPDGVAVIDHQHLQSSGAHLTPLLILLLPSAASLSRPNAAFSLVKSGPSRSLPCAPRIRGRSSSWAPAPMGFQGRCHVRANRWIRRKSNRRSDTSRFWSRSQLKGESNRMQRLYRGPFPT